MKRKLTRIPALLCVLTMLFVLMTVTVSAESKNYTINGEDKIAIPEVYQYEYSINTAVNAQGERTSFEQPTDLFMDKNGHLYVVDTQQNRIVKMTTKGELLQIFTEADGKAFSSPKGIFVNDAGEIFVADSNNSRVVHMTAQGEFIRSFGLPDSPLLADVTVYTPTKIGQSPSGALYVLMGENIMSLDDENNFRGYIGQTDIGFDFLDALLRLVASDEQKKVIEKRVASPYTNFCMDARGMIYAVSRDQKEGQLKVLNTVGNNIYRKVGGVSSEWNALDNLLNSLFSSNLLSKQFQYGERYMNLPPVFTDICVNDMGIVTVTDSNSRRLYQYDASGNLLAVFGGEGELQGEFSIPVSIITDEKGYLYVLDQSSGNITVMSPTPFILAVQQATVAYDNGDYAKADALWQEVLEIDETYPMAHFGAGRTAFKSGDWKKAMQYYTYSSDREQYSDAFKEYRYSIIKANFWWVVLIGVAIVTVLVILFIQVQRRAKRTLVDFELKNVDQLGLKGGLLLGFSILVHPFRTFTAIKYGRGRIRMYAPIVIFLAVLFARFFFIFTVHYPLQDIELEDVNIILELVKQFLPIFTWIGAVYLISAQFDGESTLKENFTAAAYSMVPYVLVTLLAAGMSQVMCWNESGLWSLLVNGVMVWYILLLIIAVHHLNDYSFGHTLVVCIISVLAMVLIWFVALFAYSLVVCLVQFFRDIYLELQLML